MALTPNPAPESTAEREHQVAQVLSGLKTIADLTDSSRSKGEIVSRVGAKLVAAGVKTLPAEKQAADEVQRSSVALAALAERHLGADWVEYEPDTLKDALGLNPDEVTAILFARHVLYEQTTFTDWHVFEKTVIAFNGRVVDFDITQDVNAFELAWAVDEIRYIDGVTPFSEEVASYIAVMLRNEGLVVVPEALAFVAETLGRITYPVTDPEALRIQRERISTINQFVVARHAKLLKEIKDIK